ncbi:hypothetical protein F4604DRAFT_1957590 [Suillus subluteus]|nr:hypothetical protein F4604DRAFT_1957590 [Suillus subluteus]
MNQNMKPQFLSLAGDLHAYILTFLSYRDILRCASVCTGLRQTYLSSSELQYIVELGGQQLLPVNLQPGVDDHVPISERLQLLRDKAHAWFKFNTRPVQTVIVPKIFYSDKAFVSNGHVCLCDTESLSGFAKIFPIAPEPPQQAIDREWSSESLSSLPNTQNIDVLMDPEQNLIAAAYDIIGGSGVYIDLLALDGDGVHPQAAGRTLIMSPGLPGRQNMDFEALDSDSDKNWRLESLGRHIALWRHESPRDEPERLLWWLQIWDWQYSTMSNCVLSGTVFDAEQFDGLIDFCFLGSNRLLIVMNDNLKVYSIEDMSQAPELLACFLFPAQVQFIRCFPSKINLNLARTQRTMWTSDPAHRLLSLLTYSSEALFHFVISASIFFQLDLFEGMTTAVPWKHWGPLNSRVFQDNEMFGFGLGGSRVFKAIPSIIERSYSDLVEYRLHMMDFSPLAVKHQQGLGQVVREPSTIDLEGELVTTSLPYVEVVSDTKSSHEPTPIWVDKDRIYVLQSDTASLEVIKV